MRIQLLPICSEKDYYLIPMDVEISGDYDNIMVLYKCVAGGSDDFTENSQSL